MFCLFHPFFLFPAPSCPGDVSPQELPTLCGSSATGLFSAASQIASWGSQIAIACGESDLGFEDFFRRLFFLKTSKKHGFSQEIPLPPKR